MLDLMEPGTNGLMFEQLPSVMRAGEAKQLADTIAEERFGHEFDKLLNRTLRDIHGAASKGLTHQRFQMHRGSWVRHRLMFEKLRKLDYQVEFLQHSESGVPLIVEVKW